MSAEELIRAGQVDEALAALQQDVRSDPADPKKRVFLFQLLTVLGQWQRALTQLNVAAEMDPLTLAMAQTYREAIRCELFREEVFAGKRAPLVFGAPEQWIALLLQSLRLGAQGEYAHAADVRDRAFEDAPTTDGTIGADAFEWIADADSRLGPVVEAVVNGKYYWIPFNRIRTIALDEPEDLRDFVWTPAHFTWANGGESVALIPTRYPGSHEHANPAVKLARFTDWEEKDSDTFFGMGQRLLATDGGEYSLLDVRTIELNSPEEAGDEGEQPPAPAGDDG